MRLRATPISTGKMLSPNQLEDQYRHFMGELKSCSPEEIVRVDIHLLHSLGLLGERLEESAHQPLTHYFHVIETTEKITLFNERFAVWIVPVVLDGEAVTYTLVAQTNVQHPRLELVLASSGVYNSSRIVLQVLERMLEEIEENESTLARLSDEPL
jgi:hypothetical protein